MNTSSTTSEDPGVLAAQLAGKQVFLIVEQENWTDWQMAAFGTAIGPVLREFVQTGGLVIVCDGAPIYGASRLLANAGLMNATISSAGSYSARLAAWHPVTQGVDLSFSSMESTACYSSIGDARALVTETSTNNPMVAIKGIGSGQVLLLGWNYAQYNNPMARILANAVQILGRTDGAVLTQYDVYLDTSNPPAQSVVQGTYATQFAPAQLSYNTTYFWRVVARNSSGETSSTVWSFKTGRTTSEPVGIFSPASGAVVSDYSPLAIDWQADIISAGTAVLFQLYLDGSWVDDLGKAWTPYATGISTVTLPLLPTSGKYRIRAVSLWNSALFGDSAQFYDYRKSRARALAARQRALAPRLKAGGPLENQRHVCRRLRASGALGSPE